MMAKTQSEQTPARASRSRSLRIESKSSVAPARRATNGSRTTASYSALSDRDITSLLELIQHAYMRLLAGDPRNAQHALEQALSSEGMPSHDASKSANTRYRSGVGQRSTETAKSRSDDENWNLASPRIVIKTLGNFHVSVDGECPVATRKPPHRLLAILKLMIASGGCAVNSSTLADQLWPDLDGDRAHDAMQVALHRLRKMLGAQDVLLMNRGRITLNTRLVEVDAFMMDSLCRDPFLPTFQARAHAALELYQGPFLPEEMESSWAVRTRECLRAKFVNVIETAARELVARGDHTGAASLYERAMTVDDVENVLRDGLVRTLRRSKRHSDEHAVLS